jgi:hypothetical protein
VDINRGWEKLPRKIVILWDESAHHYELCKIKHDLSLSFKNYLKQAKFQWLQIPVKVSENKIRNVERELRKREHLQTELVTLKETA